MCSFAWCRELLTWTHSWLVCFEGIYCLTSGPYQLCCIWVVVIIALLSPCFSYIVYDTYVSALEYSGASLAMVAVFRNGKLRDFGGTFPTGWQNLLGCKPCEPAESVDGKDVRAINSKQSYRISNERSALIHLLFSAIRTSLSLLQCCLSLPIVKRINKLSKLWNEYKIGETWNHFTRRPGRRLAE